MALSNAQRQAAYRARHSIGAGVWRLNTPLSVTAKRSLQRMATREGVSQRDLLERMLIAAEDRTLAKLTAKQRSAYFNATP